MIHEALRHAAGVGPVRLAQLHTQGIHCWGDVLTRQAEISIAIREALVAECQRCSEAQAARDVRYFVSQLHQEDKWRILTEYLAETTFFDIETDGLEHDSRITVIACWHRGQLEYFVEHENLDDFLTLLDDVTLLASFNGSSFDVPRVLDAFHIPDLPCPHLDLRWPAYHQGWSGGLKEILRQLNVQRPEDLTDVDGEVAIHLWGRWVQTQDEAARGQLLRYCASDVLALVVLASHLARCEPPSDDALWQHLPAAPTAPHLAAVQDTLHVFRGDAFGAGSPSRMRAFRSRRARSG